MPRRHRDRRTNTNWSGAIIGALAVIMIVFISIYFFKPEVLNVKPTPYGELLLDSKYYSGSENPDWHRVDFGPFSIESSQDYRFFKIQGIDSYIGGLTNLKDTLIFDYGWYSNELNDYAGENYVVSSETVNGRDFKLIREDNQIGFAGAFTKDLEKDNRLSMVCFECHDLDQKIEMFRTIEIK